MEYCRNLKFEEDPDYKYIIGIFEKCMTRNGFDLKSTDYTWKQNRLSKDKEALKNSVLNVIKKKLKEKNIRDLLLVIYKYMKLIKLYY